MPVRTIVQVPLTGFRLPAEALRAELERGGRPVILLQAYTQVVMVSMAQLILCNRAHRLDRELHDGCCRSMSASSAPPST